VLHPVRLSVRLSACHVPSIYSKSRIGGETILNTSNWEHI